MGEGEARGEIELERLLTPVVEAEAPMSLEHEGVVEEGRELH